MRLYHAGAEGDAARLYAAGIRRALVSYAGSRAGLQFWMDQPDADVFLDSGAFAAHAHGRQVDLPAYCAFLSEYGAMFSAYAALDVIGDWRATARNADEMAGHGLRPVPTFHRGSPLAELNRLVRDHRHVALGGLMSHDGRKVHRQTREDLQPYLDACWRVLARHWPVRVHVFGVAAHQWILERYPFYSADSATVKIGASLGTYARFLHGVVRWKYWWEDVPQTLDGALGDLGLQPKAAAREARWKASAGSLCSLERYVTDLWGARGVVWDA